MKSSRVISSLSAVAAAKSPFLYRHKSSVGRKWRIPRLTVRARGVQVRALGALQVAWGMRLEGPAVVAGVVALVRAGRFHEAEAFLLRHPAGRGSSG